jgi:regulator of nonsense transcripts 1
VEAERLLKGSRVILCTLSMLSNDRISSFSRIVPPNLFIFDEASQIEVGDYIPMLHRYQKTVRKLVFIGDDKQCAFQPSDCSR